MYYIIFILYQLFCFIPKMFIHCFKRNIRKTPLLLIWILLKLKKN